VSARQAKTVGSATPGQLSPALFSFLRDLADHNDREWFAENKARYVEDVQEPAIAFVATFEKPLTKISPNFRADARPMGGSLFRIHRDIRFSKDKTPYKTHTGIHFRHRSAGDVHAPGFYLHLEPGAVFAAAGIWHPDGAAQGAIRDAIVDDPAGWKRATGGDFSKTYTLTGDSLKRPPPGFDPDHPLIEILKRKDFVAETPLTEKAVTAPGFPEEYARLCRTAAPFLRFLCAAVGVPF
jgi:uncharacterized protein (TIGR02453 family)